MPRVGRGPVSPDPFLPRAVQLSHGVPGASAELAAAESRRILDRLLGSAGEVILSAPEVDDDAPLLPSPLLDGVPTMDLDAGWSEPRLAVTLHAHRPALERRVDGQMPPVSTDEAGRGGARLLELQSACPFRAQTELRLGARKLEEPGVGVDAAERGDLVHKALAALWLELGSQEALKSLDPAGLKDRHPMLSFVCSGVQLCFPHESIKSIRFGYTDWCPKCDQQIPWITDAK